MPSHSLTLWRLLLVTGVVFVFEIAASPLSSAPPTPAPPEEQSDSPPAESSEAADQAAFEQLDGNEDELLSGKEAVSILAYDTNGDKRITKSEFLAARAKAREVDPAVEDGKQFSQLDGNEDDFLSGKEMKGLERYDANSDREISKAEFLAGRAADRTVKPPIPLRSATLATFDTFFASLAQRNAKAMIGQMHPALQLEVDEPVLQFLVDTIHTELGAMSDDEPDDRKQEEQDFDGGRATATTATVEFSRGSAVCESVIHDGKVISFNITSDKLTDFGLRLGELLVTDKAFRQQVSDYYAPRLEIVIRWILQGKSEEVYGLLHPEVQKQLSLEEVGTYVQDSQTEFGELKKLEFDGTQETHDAESGALKKFAVLYKLDCENGPGQGKVILEFEGMHAALVGFGISEPSEEASPQPDLIVEETTIYRCMKDKLSDRHADGFVPFRFSYPDGWELDPTAGTESNSNIAKVMRNLDLGGGVTFTQENFAIGSCQVPGDGELAKTMLQVLSEQFRASIAKGFPEYKLNREGDMKFGKYDGFGFEFTSKLPHPSKGKVDCWGRVILLAPSEIGQDHGLSIVMLATSEAPELKSLADLGVKGQLPVIINSFKVGAMESDDPELNAKVAAHYDRAAELAEQGDTKGAIAEMTAALIIEPENLNGYIERGNLRYLNKDLQGAAADYSMAIKIDSNNVVAHNNRGAMRYYLDDLDGAMQEYELVIQLDDQYAMAYLNRGLVKLLRRQDADAQRDFDTALQLDLTPEFAAQQADLVREAKLRREKAIPAPPVQPRIAPPKTN